MYKNAIMSPVKIKKQVRARILNREKKGNKSG